MQEKQNIQNCLKFLDRLRAFFNNIEKCDDEKTKFFIHRNLFYSDVEYMDTLISNIESRLKELKYYDNDMYFSKDENFEDFAEKFMLLKNENIQLKDQLAKKEEEIVAAYFKGSDNARKEIIDKMSDKLWRSNL